MSKRTVFYSVIGAVVLLSLIVLYVVMSKAPESPVIENAAATLRPRKRTELERYADLELMATPDRAKEFTARVRPIGEKPLFEEFSTDTADVGKLASTMTFTSVTSDAAGNRSPSKTVAAPDDLEEQRYPLKLYDLSLNWSRDQVIDRMLLESFVKRWDLSPSKETLVANVSSEGSGLAVTVKSSEGETTSYLPEVSRDKASEAEIAQLTQQSVDAVWNRMVVSAFERRLQEFASPDEVAKFFPAGRVPSIDQIVAFLKSRAAIEKSEPALVKEERVVQQEQQEFNARQETEARLLEAYFQKRGLTIPADKIELKVSRNPRDITIAVSSKEGNVKPYRQQIPRADFAPSSEAAEKQTIATASKVITRVFQWQAGVELFSKRFAELVSAEDQKEFFDGGKTVNRARLLKYLEARAEPLGLQDALLSPEHDHPPGTPNHVH